MENEQWLDIDSKHIILAKPIYFTCTRCGQEYMYVRDRCPFCNVVVNEITYDDKQYWVDNRNLYTEINDVIYIYDHDEQTFVTVDYECRKLDAKTQQVKEQYEQRQEQQEQQYRQSKPQVSYDNSFGNMISTTIAGLILFALFVIIVAFIDIVFFHGA